VDDPGAYRLFSRRLTSGQLIALDVAAALAYCLLLVSFVLGAGNAAASEQKGPVWVRVIFACGIALPLALRRVRPLTVFGAVGILSLLSTSAGLLNDHFVGAAFALYMVALSRSTIGWRWTLVIAGMAVIAALSAVAVGPVTLSWASIPLDIAILGGAWTVGRAVRERRAYASRSMKQLAHQAVVEERLRVARELHDVIAQSMSLIAVKAGVANHVLPSRPDEAHEALRVIEATSRNALNEMRALLGVLRSDPDSGQEAVRLAPTPGVRDLHELTRQAAIGGVEVSMETTGLDFIPEGVGLTVYRVVQEALTNVVKHAAPARCRVSVAANQQAVSIEITDDGRGGRDQPKAEEFGHGLLGMRERVKMYGGSFSAGPGQARGFTVSARLPYRRSENTC